jgi:hypothetical protein
LRRGAAGAGHQQREDRDEDGRETPRSNLQSRPLR